MVPSLINFEIELLVIQFMEKDASVGKIIDGSKWNWLHVELWMEMKDATPHDFKLFIVNRLRMILMKNMDFKKSIISFLENILN